MHRDGRIETRSGNWHDLFNALCWLAWPRAKAALNALHVQQAQADQTAPRRGAARDLATLFDESGAVLACSDPALTALLRDFRWAELFCARRAQVLAGMRCFVFGHALLDKARAPYKGLTAHALVLPVRRDFLSLPAAQQVGRLDAMLAEWFAESSNLDGTRRLSPLPLTGLPGFCKDNANPAYYDDINVFRAGRARNGNMTRLTA